MKEQYKLTGGLSDKELDLFLQSCTKDLPFSIGQHYEKHEFVLEPVFDSAANIDKYVYLEIKNLRVENYHVKTVYLYFHWDILTKIELVLEPVGANLLRFNKFRLIEEKEFTELVYYINRMEQRHRISKL